MRALYWRQWRQAELARLGRASPGLRCAIKDVTERGDPAEVSFA